MQGDVRRTEVKGGRAAFHTNTFTASERAQGKGGLAFHINAWKVLLSKGSEEKVSLFVDKYVVSPPQPPTGARPVVRTLYSRKPAGRSVTSRGLCAAAKRHSAGTLLDILRI